MGTTARQIGSAMVWSLVARGGRFILGIASSVIVVRSLGESDYGVLSLIRAVMMFVIVIAGAGSGQALLKFLPSLRVRRRGTEARRLVRRVLAVHLAVWLLSVAVCIAGRHLWERVFSFDGIGVLITAAVSLSLFEVLFTLLSQVVNSNYDTQRLSLASLASHGVYIIGLAILLPRGLGVIGVLVATAAGYLVACALVVPRVAPATTFDEEAVGGESLTSGARLWKYSAPFALIGVLNLIVWRQSETMFLAHFRSAAETGWFDLAYRIPQIVLEFVPGAVWPLVMAGVSEAYAREPGSLAAAIDRYYRMLFVLSAPVAVVGSMLGGKLIPIVFGEAMAPAALPTRAFFAIFAVSFLGTPLSMSLYVLGKTHINLIIYGILAVINIGLDLLLIPRYGVIGAVIPVALVIVLSPFLYRAAVRRHVAAVRIPWRFIGRCYAASGCSLVLWPFLRYVDSALTLAAAAAAAGLIVVLAFRLMRVIGPEEKRLLESIPAPLASRLLKFVAP